MSIRAFTKKLSTDQDHRTSNEGVATLGFEILRTSVLGRNQILVQNGGGDNK